MSRLTGRMRDWAFDDFGVRAVYVVLLVLACMAATQSDTYWLLRAGRDFWHSGRIAESDTYTYTVAGADWPNHEWLWEALAYPVHLVGGLPLLTLVSAFLFVGALAISLRLSTARGPARIALALAVPVLLAPQAAPRPQTASIFLFMVVIALVARERYWLLVPVFLVWANLHAAVASGGLVLVACTAAAAVGAARARTASSRERLRKIALATTFAGLATLATPMGIDLWGYVLTSHARSKANNIGEWLSPLQLLGPQEILFLAVVALAALVTLRRWRRILTWADAVPLIAAVAMLPMALDAIRNIPAFMLAVVPVLVTMLGQPPGTEQSRVGRPLIPLGALVVLGAVTTGIVWSAPPPRMDWQPLTSEAGRQLEACPGRIYTTYDTGGYVEWFAPGVKTYIDNRQDPFPDEMVQQSFELDEKGKYSELFDRWDIGCAVVAPRSELALALQRHGWRAVFLSPQAQIFVRG